MRSSRAIAGLVAVCGCSLLFAQDSFSSNNVQLKAHVDLSTLGASRGNDCWGYVSPSGREYALMGTNNKTAFVEVTDPSNPVYFAQIPHTSSTWSDIKTYQNYAYVVTEASGTGIQVIDLSDIDSHIITLVRTIPSPSRSHNVAIDTVSGFLYTVGSNGGTGTTMCFDLSDPANPTQVGSQSITPFYQHDVQVKTYTNPELVYGGRQIMFGSGEGRGLEIWDVTDKANVTLIRRIAYPNVGYCHQCWLSPDGRYLYVNDEFDEFRNNIPTRTLVFDVSNLNNPRLVSTFSTGKPSIDHNLYVRNDYIFQANYTSGLRVFDANDDPENPIEVGFFDTYPENNGASFNGSWSNYPFFPSGTVIISDINRGLFIVDVDQAVERKITPHDFDVNGQTRFQGELSDLFETDGDLALLMDLGSRRQRFSRRELTVMGESLWSDPGRIVFKVSTAGVQEDITRRIELFDFDSNSWVILDSREMDSQPETIEKEVLNAGRFVSATGEIRGRLSFNSSFTFGTRGSTVRVNEASWMILP